MSLVTSTVPATNQKPAAIRSLRHRLNATFHGMLIAAIVLCGGGGFLYTYRVEMLDWQQREAEAIHNGARVIGLLVSDVHETLATAGMFDPAYLTSTRGIMQSYLEQNSSLAEITRVDVKGRLIASASRDTSVLALLPDVPEADWFKWAQAGLRYTGSVETPPGMPPYLVLAVRAPDGGVVAARLRLDVLRDVVADARFHTEGQTYLVDRMGQVLVHSDPHVPAASLSIGGRPELETWINAPNNEWSGEYRDYRGVVSVGSVAPIEGTQWLVVASLPRTAAYASTRGGLLYIVVLTVIIGLLATMILRRLLNITIMHPIERLRAGVERIGQGDLEYRIAVTHNDEIGQVATAFNDMASRLRQRNEQLMLQAAELAAQVAERQLAQEALEKLNGALEERVAARTTELTREIGERKRAEAELRLYADKLEQSNRELQEFAYVASHDLQEPLRKVRAFGDRLHDKYAPVLGEQGCDYLTRMQSAAARMQTLIDGLLSYSRVTTKAQPFVPVDLKQTTMEVLSDLEMRIEQVGGRVEVGDLPTIEADPLQMRQLLQNLIGNALKFHKDDAAPVVRVSAQLLNGHEPAPGEVVLAPDKCRICVRDNGIGFEEKYTERIFQVFQRLHGRGAYEGAGIGLAVCRKIAERHHGTIMAHSTLGDGSTFTVTLPLRQNEHLAEGEVSA
jgi:signal transduction histidine kinase